MSFKKTLVRFLDEYGSDATVNFEDEQYSVKALIEPMRYKNKLYLEMGISELGLKDGECFLYLGPAIPDFSGTAEGVKVVSGDRAYDVSRADRISLGSETVYIWAVLTPRILEGNYDIS